MLPHYGVQQPRGHIEFGCKIDEPFFERKVVPLGRLVLSKKAEELTGAHDVNVQHRDR